MKVLDAETLVEAALDCLSALFPQTRQVAPRLRVFLDWVGTIFGAI